MSSTRRKVIFLARATLLFFVTSMAMAETTLIQDLDSRTIYYRSTYTANEDFTYQERNSSAIKVLNDRAIKQAKRRSVSYSSSIESIDILEAYNLKENGDKVHVPKDNYQIQTNRGRDEGGPVFSDRGSISVVFPDLEVGDTVVFSYTRTANEPMFPKYFTAANYFSTSQAYDEVVIELNVPKSYHGNFQSQGMKETITKHKDNVHYAWKWDNKNPVLDTRQDYSVWDMEASIGFSYSTFDSYKAIAQAYGKRALPKVVKTERVAALANSIVGDVANKKEQAKLIYEWVATNITYAGNCVGVGAVVPHDISFILDNNMGDCKDHATLLQALLEVKHIKSIQALINSGNIFSLPTVPMVSSVNHVINYLPEFNLFVDSTSNSTPFGLLPKSIQGKPVLLVTDFKKNMKTPSSKQGSNTQSMTSEMIINKDGGISGSTTVNLTGEPAVIARAGWRPVSKDNETQWLKNYFTSNGQTGTASLVKDDPKALKDSFNYTFTFEHSEFLLSDSAGAFHIDSPATSYLPLNQLAWAPDQVENHPTTCSHGSSSEVFIYTFPDNFKILDIPKNKSIEAKYINFNATYELDGKKLTIKRELADSTPGPICTPDILLAQQGALKKISRHLRSQIVYKPLDEDD